MGKEERTKYNVSVVKCSKYDSKLVRNSLLQSFRNIDFHLKEFNGKKVLIKPNILSAHKPEKALTTHPIVLEELCKILKEQGVREIYIGDSSAYDTDIALKVSGIAKLNKYAKIINFEKEDKKFFKLGKGELSNVPLPKILFDVDFIINFAKMKTHVLAQTTLCVKNLYGCVPGMLKEKYHKLLPDSYNFGKLLLAIHDRVKPELNFIDGIVGLEGEGPGASGVPKKAKVIVASRNAKAADIIASEIMGFKANHVPTNKLSKIKRKQIQVFGSGKDLKYNFVKPKSHMVPLLMFIMRFTPKSKITFDWEKCTKCGLCGSKCPVKAISYKEENNKFPCCDHKKCIRCLCCVEVCPQKAVSLEDAPSMKAVKLIAKKIRLI